jgi:outer membrane biosynthesis protein TonB
MAQRARSYFFRAASALALALLIAGCTKGGQFDPTEIFSSDVFDSKKKLKGERSPVFPEGVPGASSGVPADLVKGYEPPPEQPDPDAAVPGLTPPEAAEVAKPKPKPKPKPKLAAQKPPASPAAAAPAAGPTRIKVGPGQKPAPQQPDAPVWPAAPSTKSPQSQTSQSVWPAPPQTTSSPPAQPSQSIWPDSPSGGSSR